MPVPCCTPDGFGGFVCTMVEDERECFSRPECGTDNEHGCTVGPDGALCESIGGSWACTRRDISDINVDCCFPGQQAINTFFSNCVHEDHGGFVITPDNPCIPDAPPPACMEAQPDRIAPSGKRWTTDLQGTVAFGLSSEPTDRGFDVPTTDHLVRPEEPRVGEVQPCVHLQAREVMLDDGYVYVEACSKPDRNNPDSIRVSYCPIATVEGEGDLKDGYQYAIGAIHLPWWTDAIVRSHQERCQAPLR